MKLKFSIAVGLGLLAASAMANSITYDLAFPNDTTAIGATGPFGTLTVTTTTTGASLDFVAAADYFFGNGSSVAANVNGTGFSSSVGSVTPGTVTLSLESPGQNLDGKGIFNLIYGSGNFSPGARFTEAVINVTGSWSDAANVLIANSDGYIAAAHVFWTDGPTGNNTGWVAAKPGTPSVPDGGITVLLLGAALTGLGAIRSRLAK